MGDRKRRLSCNGGENDSEDSLLCKRFCGLSPEAEELLNILEDAEEERSVAEEEIVCCVMKSLEEEITSGSSVENEAFVETDTRSCDVENEIRYLLSASDDELGIPPSPSVSDSPLFNNCESYGGASDESSSDIVESLFWHFENGDCKLAAPVGGEFEEGQEERDFGACSGLVGVCQGDVN
ncbi:hypothetical protein SUGI_1100700 [Cryptomeria japonica]|uniref:uncharacterized protein LOC131043268 n=1 Tax=Cryptomeria japonica TaxID=3369 RepID=UPI0024148797|nr:uncharacterized protein LOC131043268 [Cryptomeria japonica]GLJ51805.1 hypothetical protein SUGI_1100700 [Cryptomeria japonica]